MSIKDKITSKIKSEKLQRLIADYGARTMTFFALSIIINVAFALYNGVLGIVNHSVWYGALATYYIFLTLQRFSLLLSHNLLKNPKYAEKKESAKQKIYIGNGVLLFVLEAALTGSAFLAVTSQKPVKTGTIAAITTATFAFYKITMAIINLRKTSKLGDPILQAARNIGFVDATVSMLALTSTLISTFGNPDEMRTTLLLTAAGVFALTTALAVFMIARGAKRLQASKV